MKNIFYILTLVFLITSCNSSTKGNWSASDKKRALDAANEVMVQEGASSENTDFLKNCFLEKVEQQFNSLDEANEDVAGLNKVTEECLQELYARSGSTKGHWSSEDLEKLNEVNEEFRSIYNRSDVNIDALIDCYTSKMESTYSCFLEANNDEMGIEFIVESCMIEQLPN